MSAKTSYALPVATLASAAYLVARLFVWPGIPIVLGSDQAFFWMYGDRMLDGELPYRDFFQFTPPGVDLVFLAAFRLFGASFWVTNAVVVLLGAALGGLCFRVARALMGLAGAALATSVFVVFVFGHALSATHHFWSVLFVMGAVAALGDGERRGSYVLAGGFLGVAAFCTQTHGLAALVACLVFAIARSRRRGLAWRESFARSGLLLGAFAVKLAILWSYFVAKVGFGVIVACVVTYVWRDMGAAAPGWGLGLPDALTGESLRWLAPYLVVYALVPIGLLASISSTWARRTAPPNDRDDRILLLGLVGLALAIEVSMSLSWIRVFAVAMPGILLAIGRLEEAPRGKEVAFRTASLLVACVALIFLRSTYRHHTEILDLPAGRAASEPAKSAEIVWLHENVPAGSPLFAADRPQLYLPLGLHNPLYLDAAIPSRQTTPALAQRAVQDLERLQLRYLVWSDVLDPSNEPGAHAEGLDGVLVLRRYLHAHYHSVHAFEGGDELWVRD